MAEAVKAFLEPLMNACLLFCERGQTKSACAGACVCVSIVIVDE